MSEQEKIDLITSLRWGMAKATRAMLDRKAKLGEPVIVADADGQPVRISAEDAMRRLDRSTAESETKTMMK